MAGYKIEIEFGPNWVGSGRSFLFDAAKRWMTIVTSSPPPADIGGGRIVSGLLVRADIKPGAAGGVLARSGPENYRPESAGYFPAAAILELEQGDYDALRIAGRLSDVLFHELAHGMGFGFLWTWKGLIQGVGTADPLYIGPLGKAAYGAMKGSGPIPVPVEAGGGTGVAGRHWRESALGSEIMSPYLPGHPNPLSALTLASMADLGYSIDQSKAEPFTLPVAGKFMEWQADGAEPLYRVIPTIPTILPETSIITATAKRRAATPSAKAKLGAASPEGGKGARKARTES